MPRCVNVAWLPCSTLGLYCSTSFAIGFLCARFVFLFYLPVLALRFGINYCHFPSSVAISKFKVPNPCYVSARFVPSALVPRASSSRCVLLFCLPWASQLCPYSATPFWLLVSETHIIQLFCMLLFSFVRFCFSSLRFRTSLFCFPFL